MLCINKRLYRSDRPFRGDRSQRPDRPYRSNRSDRSDGPFRRSRGCRYNWRHRYCGNRQDRYCYYGKSGARRRGY